MADRIRRNGQTVGVQKTFHVETLRRFLSTISKDRTPSWNDISLTKYDLQPPMGFNGCKKKVFFLQNTLIIHTNNIVRHYVVNGGAF